jgi:hypothetical protein
MRRFRLTTATFGRRQPWLHKPLRLAPKPLILLASCHCEFINVI